MTPLVVFLKGVNVGGHRTFRPSVLAKELKRFDVANLGAAGTFIVRRPVSRSALRIEIARRLPFTTEIMICDGRDILRLATAAPFGDQPSGRDVVPFVSILARRTASLPRAQLTFPPAGDWELKVLAQHDRFVVGMYRRNMRAIGYLTALEKALGVPVTTRSWSTMLGIVRALGQPAERDS